MENKFIRSKSDFKRIVSFVVLIALCVGLMPMFSYADEGTNDVTEYITMSNVDVYIDDDNKYGTEYIIGGEPKHTSGDALIPLYIGQGVMFKAYWHVTESDMQNINESDWFTVALPSYFTFKGQINEKLEINGVERGLFSVYTKDGISYMKIVFTDLSDGGGGTVTELINGVMFAYGNAKSASDGDGEINIGGVDIPKIPVIPNDNSGGSEIGYITQGGALYKDGAGTSYARYSSWTIGINGHEYIQALRGLINVGNMTEYPNVILEDELEDGLTFSTYPDDNLTEAYNFEFLLPVFPISGSGVLSYHLGNFDVSDLFVEIPQESETSYGAFKALVSSSSAPCYGVFDNKKLVVNFGDFPGDLKINMTESELETKIDGFISDLSPGVQQAINNSNIRQDTIDTYSKFIDGGEFTVPFINVFYYTYADGSSRTLNNKAKLYFAEQARIPIQQTWYFREVAPQLKHCPKPV